MEAKIKVLGEIGSLLIVDFTKVILVEEGIIIEGIANERTSRIISVIGGVKRVVECDNIDFYIAEIEEVKILFRMRRYENKPLPHWQLGADGAAMQDGIY